MLISSDELEQLMGFGVRLAQEAGELTSRYFRKVSARRKADGSLVTEADFETERFLRSEIEKHFPQDGILGEEEGERAGRSGRRWIIDPIDGTFSFAHGVPLYGVLIALETEGEVVVGVINIPAAGEMAYAARGCGSFLNGNRVRTTSVSKLDEALLLSTDFGMIPDEFRAASESLQRSVEARRTWGDCYGHLLVGTGRAEIMLDPLMKVWDCAPLLPIVEEAGGTFTDWQGRRTIYGGSAISTNGALFKQVLEILHAPESGG